MRQSVWLKVLAGVVPLLFLAACSQTYSYIPKAPGSTAPAPGGAAPPPQAEAPVQKAPDLKDQVQALEDRVQQLEGRLAQLESYMAAPTPPTKTRQTTAAPPRATGAEKAFAEGERLYKAKKYKEAAAEFSQVATHYPKSTYAPAALLREAYAYKNLKQTQNYQNTLKKLVQAYPKSSEAKEAQKYLKEGSH